jgi:hypothetical protein
MQRRCRSFPTSGPVAAHAVVAVLVAALGSTTLPGHASAQGLKIAVGDVGLGIGPVPRIDGLRLNFRDDERFERVRGINVTVWSPREDVDGEVQGIAVGLPLTGARSVQGLGVGAGLAAFDDFRGIAVAGLGMGAGRNVTGIAVAGLGAGAGGSLEGLAVGGLGIGAGGSIEGIAVGGLGVGSGGDVTGLLVGGLGAGVGGDGLGILLAGLGAGAGGDVTGLAVTGLGVGAGGTLEGVFLTGGGVGAGTALRGVAVAGLGVGSPRIQGVAVALGVGGWEVDGLVVAPAYFRVTEGGRITGAVISAYNDIRGAQNGLAIGLVNIADELHGVQVGVINIARNKDRFPVLPLVNYHP